MEVEWVEVERGVLRAVVERVEVERAVMRGVW